MVVETPSLVESFSATIGKKNARGLTRMEKVEAVGIITPLLNVAYEQKKMAG